MLTSEETKCLCFANSSEGTETKITMVVSTDPGREQVLKLMEEKTKIECKIADLGMVLHTVSLLAVKWRFAYKF